MIEGIFSSSSQWIGDEPRARRVRARRLTALGYPPSQAVYLATTTIDIDQLERLIGAGCSLDLAVRIAL